MRGSGLMGVSSAATMQSPGHGGGMRGSGLMGVSSAATMQSPGHGGGMGGSGLMGVLSAATMQSPGQGGGMGGSGLMGVSSTAMLLPAPVEVGGVARIWRIGVANAEEVMVAATKVLKITLQIFVLMDFMGECSLVGRNALQRKGNPIGGHRLPQK